MFDLLNDVPPEKLAEARDGLRRLTPREREILKHAVAGETAGNSAVSLGISRRTVDVHRQQVLDQAGRQEPRSRPSA